MIDNLKAKIEQMKCRKKMNKNKIISLQVRCMPVDEKLHSSEL